MQEAFLFGLSLVGALFIVMIILVCGLIVALRIKARELNERAATSQRNKEEKVQRISNRLILKVWSCSEDEEPSFDIESNQEPSSNTNEVPEQECQNTASSSCQTVLSSVGRNEGSVCAICLGPYRDGDLVVQSCNPNCHHEFHRECITEWLAKKDECPCCRQRFLDAEERVHKKARPDAY